MKVVVEYLVLEFFKSGMVVVYVAVAVKKCVLKCVCSSISMCYHWSPCSDMLVVLVSVCADITLYRMNSSTQHGSQITNTTAVMIT